MRLQDKPLSARLLRQLAFLLDTVKIVHFLSPTRSSQIQKYCLAKKKLHAFPCIIRSCLCSAAFFLPQQQFSIKSMPDHVSVDPVASAVPNVQSPVRSRHQDIITCLDGHRFSFIFRQRLCWEKKNSINLVIASRQQSKTDGHVLPAFVAYQTSTPSFCLPITQTCEKND